MSGRRSCGHLRYVLLGSSAPIRGPRSHRVLALYMCADMDSFWDVAEEGIYATGVNPPQIEGEKARRRGISMERTLGGIR